MGILQKIVRPDSNVLLGIEEVDARPTYREGDWCDHLYLKNGFCTVCGRSEQECIIDTKSRQNFAPKGIDGDTTPGLHGGMSIQEVLRRVTLLGSKVRREHNPKAREQDAANRWMPVSDFPDKKNKQ
jgi:hypothetical protein